MGMVRLKNAGIMSVFRRLFKSGKDGQTIHRDLSGFLLKPTEYPKRMDIRPWQAARVEMAHHRITCAKTAANNAGVHSPHLRYSLLAPRSPGRAKGNSHSVPPYAKMKAHHRARTKVIPAISVHWAIIAAGHGSNRVLETAVRIDPIREDLMNAPANRYSLEFIQSMLTEKSGRVSGWFKELELRSVYQPIYSLPHKRVIGFDASLRGSDPGGKPVSAGSLFGPVENYSETCLLDLLCTTIHLHNFFSRQPPRSLLFIKLHPEVLLDAEPTAEFLASLCRHYSVPEHRLVIDVPGSILHEANAAAASEAYRRAGCLIAVNNFGVDNSNLDTISEIEPTAVRMARAVVADAARDYRAQQMLRRALSMLHEAGKLIEMEGVESEEEALAAIDADADLASGYFFGRHCEDPRQFEANGAMERLWATYKGRHADNTREEVTERASLENELLRSSVKGKLGAASPADISRYREERRPFLVALQRLTAQLQSGTDFPARSAATCWTAKARRSASMSCRRIHLHARGLTSTRLFQLSQPIGLDATSSCVHAGNPGSCRPAGHTAQPPDTRAASRFRSPSSSIGNRR
jgi:EAL domain-containing protein (putative c-di-GMP-specific phosphodiesterase class I)